MTITTFRTELKGLSTLLWCRSLFTPSILSIADAS